jgi:hypothetical protein
MTENRMTSDETEAASLACSGTRIRKVKEWSPATAVALRTISKTVIIVGSLTGALWEFVALGEGRSLWPGCGLLVGAIVCGIGVHAFAEGLEKLYEIERHMSRLRSELPTAVTGR